MNYISAAVYVLIAVSMAIGIRIAPRKKLNQDYLSLDAMTCLKGVMALFVLLHHLAQKKLFQETNTIPIFEQIGFLFVGVFFMCSGYGLYKSFKTKANYLDGFLKRRILPIVIAYYVMIIIYAVYHILTGSKFTTAEWILKLSGLVLINTQGWFVPVIILMYLSFYFIFKNEKLHKYAIPVLLAITLIQGLLFCVLNHFPWYVDEMGWWMKEGAFNNLPWWRGFCALPYEGEWWVNSTIGFTAGIMLAKHEKSFTEWFSKHFAIKFLAALVSLILITILGFYCMWNISYWTEFGGNLGFTNKLICYAVQCVQVVLTDLFIVVLMLKVRVQNKFYTFLGKRSLEMYLMQEIALFGWLFLIEQDRKPLFQPNNWNVVLYIVAVSLTVSFSATVYNLVNRTLSRGLKK